MNKNLVRTGALVLSMSLFAVACGDDTDDDASETTASAAGTTETTVAGTETTADAMAGTEVPDTVVDIATGNDDFSILVAALTEADLVETLQGDGPFTVFAPTNEAFADALVALDISQDELLARDDLGDILTYHVIASEIDSDAAIASDGKDVATVQGDTVAVTVVDGSVMINDATVTGVDNKAGNGIVHIIDKVLLPPAE